MTVAEGGGRRAIARKFQDVYLPALKAMYIVWPAVQIMNFRLIPLQFQLVGTRELYSHASTDRTHSPWYRRSASPGRRTCP